MIGRHGDGYFLHEHGVFEVHVSLVQNLELLPLARIMMQLSHVQIRKELKMDFKNLRNFGSLKAELGGHGHELNGHRCPCPRHGHRPVST